MLTSLFDLMAMLVWPLAMSAAAWVIVIRTLAEPDKISKVVEALTRPGSGASRKEQPFSTVLETKGRETNVQVFIKNTCHRDRAKAAALMRVQKVPEYAPAAAAQVIARQAMAILIGGGIIAVSTPPAHARRFEFDQRRTEVLFVYKMAYSTQRGRFTKVSGTLDYDEAAPEKSKINASIAVASLTTGEALVDNELKGASFFNAAASPVIAFKSLVVRPRSATAAEVSGEITVNGITRAVTLNVSLKPHDDPALKHDVGSREFIATTRIQRSAFNMTDYQSMVDDEVDLEIKAIVRPR